MKRLMYILLILLFAANVAAQDPYVIDQVCFDTQRTYRIDGEVGSTWVWMLKDADGNQVTLTNPAGIDFTDADSDGNPIRGSEVTISWDITPGTYDLSVEQTSTYGCKVHELGQIEVFPNVEADAGKPIAICMGNPINLNEATASNATSVEWKTSGDGSFDDETTLNPEYFAGTNDQLNGIVTLTLTATGQPANATCTAVSTVDVTINPIPSLVVIDPEPICAPETADLSDPAITSGSDPNLALTYWEDENATSTLTNYQTISASGTYYIKGTDPATGCFNIQPVNVSINPPLIMAITDPDPVCEPTSIDLTNGAILAGSESGLDLTYWQDEDASISLTNYTAITASGTYYIKGTNPTTNCYDIQPVIVTINPQPTLVITDPDVVCEPETIDLSNPAIYTGSTIPASSDTTYWEDAAATISLTNYRTVASGGTYYIKLEAPGGCYDIKPVTVTIDPLPILIITDPAPVCEPATIDLTDGTMMTGSESGLDLTYWQDEDASIPLVDYTAIDISGTYYIKGTNPTTNCYVVEPVNILINPRPTLVINNPDPVCSPTTIDLTDANITMGSESGLNLTYWENENTTIPLTNYTSVETSGSYYIQAENNSTGCKTIKQVTVVVNEQPQLIITDPAVVCAPETIDLSDASITAGSDVGMTFSYWEDENATVALPDYTAIVTSGTYYIQITNPTTGCTNIKPVNVTINPMPNLMITDPDPVCEPQTIDLAAATITAGSDTGLDLTYWQDEDATLPLTDFTAITTSGTYYIKGTNTTTNCYDIQPVTVIINSQPELVITDPDAVCAPETIDLSDPAIFTGSTIPAFSDTTYWEDAATTVGLINFTAVSTSGTYYIKLEAPGGCYDIKPVTVAVHPIPNLMITDPDPVCEPQTVDLSVATITTGSETGLNLTYWEDEDATIPLANYTAVTGSGTYYIKGNNTTTNCNDIQPVTVVINSQPELIITNPNAVCAPETIDLSDPAIFTRSTIPAFSDTTYWEDAAATVSLINYTTVSSNGTYYIKLEAPGSCFDIQPVTVTINPLPNLVITDPDPVCEPGTVDLANAAVTTGSDSGLNLTYWEDADATVPLSDYTVVDANGTYYIKGTNPTTNCFVIEPVNVTIDPLPSLVITNPAPVCEPETVDLSSTDITTGSEAGLTFTYWQDIDATIPLANYTSVKTSGTYYIQAENSLTECKIVDQVIVVINEQPQLIITNPATVCAPDIIDLTDLSITQGSTIPSSSMTSYWKDVTATVPIADPEHINESGTYYIKVLASSDCYDLKPVEVVINPEPELVITNPAIVCEPEIIDLSDPSITQGSTTDFPLTYWEDENATIPLTDYTAISTSGTYYIKATLGNTCPVVKPVVVTINPPPTLVVNNPPTVCAPATVDLTDPAITAGSSNLATAIITYWKDSNATQQLSTSEAEAINMSATYFIQVDAGIDCQDIQPVEVVIYPKPILVIQNPPAVCEPETIDLTADAITPGLDPDLTKTYWQEASATNEIAAPSNITSSGTYFIQVESNDGCKNIQPVEVIINKPDALTFNMSYQYCINSTPPGLPATADGGVTGNWNPAAISTSQTGFFVYSFTPDPGQCAVENTVTIEIIDQTIPVFDPMGPYCLGTVAPALPNISKNNISGSWSPSTISTDQLGSKIYSFTPDAGQCATPTTVQIQINQTLTVDAIAMSVICKGDNSGSISVTVSGGSGNYSYSWNDGNTNKDRINLYANSYTVHVTDNVSGCENETTIDVIEPTLNDTELPILTAPADVSTQCETSLPPVFQTFEEFEAAGGYATDNMGFDPVTFKLIGENKTIDGYTTTVERTYAIQDYCGNEGTATQIFQANDDTPPIAICNTIEITVDENGLYELTNADVLFIATGSSDNCTDFSDLEFSFTPMLFDCKMVGQTVTGTLTVTDFSGNASTCTTSILIKDEYAPEITCQDITLYLDENGQTFLNKDDVLTSLEDNCGIDTVFVSKTDFTCEDVGTQSGTITAVDKNEQVATCDFNVTVIDTIKPQVICNDLNIVLDKTGQFTLTPEMIRSEAYDECGIDHMEVIPSELTCDDLGTKQIRITVYDVNGNQNSCISTINVSSSNEAPVAIDDSGVTIMNIPQSLTVLNNDTDSDGAIDPATLSIVNPPSHGMVQINSDHTITYIPEDMYIGTDQFTYRICDDGIPCNQLCDEAAVNITVIAPNVAPIANEDFFEGGCQSIVGSVVTNDFDPDDDKLIVTTSPTIEPVNGTVTLFEDGTFRYEFDRGTAFTDSFAYEVCDNNQHPLCSSALVYITIVADSDCDGIPDNIDIDDDNDGIIDTVEGDGSIDSDGDGIPDSLDSDSDNDGIVDIIEAQAENEYVAPSGFDENENGLDDIYESGAQVGLETTDTDEDGTPDYLDRDSDNDGVPDNIEGYDTGARGIAELIPEFSDIDGDGLDDAYDNFFGSYNPDDLDNPFGTDPHLQDFDNDGTRDWRDTDDDNDLIPTIYEDLNNNNIYYDDDIDGDGHPEYLDMQGDCTMFIPEGFSPNGDGIHDYFQIYCIDRYPNAKLLIFDRWGEKMYEHEHYGNLTFWESYEKAWWDGSHTNDGQFSSDKLAPGNYLYILIKGDGNMERGFVMISY